MKYEIGDKVLVLHSKEEGTVVEFMNDQMILIEVEGVRFPVYLDQIDFPYFTRFTEKKIVPAKKIDHFSQALKKSKEDDLFIQSTGLYFSFLPVFNKDVFDEDVVQVFKMYLVNKTEENYIFTYKASFAGADEFELEGKIESQKDCYLHEIEFEAMNDAPKFSFEFSLEHPKKSKAIYFESSLKIKAKQLFQKIEEMKLEKKKNFVFRLFESYPDKIEEVLPEYNYADGNLYDASRAKEKLEPARSVVDLHIEKLTDNWKGLSNFEILTIQLQHFEKYYQLAIAHRQPNLIIIHGVGKGKLKNEIHEILKTKKEVASFANQYHSNFGFGATEIFFQY